MKSLFASGLTALAIYTTSPNLPADQIKDLTAADVKAANSAVKFPGIVDATLRSPSTRAMDNSSSPSAQNPTVLGFTYEKRPDGKLVVNCDTKPENRAALLGKLGLSRLPQHGYVDGASGTTVRLNDVRDFVAQHDGYNKVVLFTNHSDTFIATLTRPDGSFVQFQFDNTARYQAAADGGHWEFNFCVLSWDELVLAGAVPNQQIQGND